MNFNGYFLLFLSGFLCSGCLFMDVPEDDTYYKIPTPKGDYLILRGTGPGWVYAPEDFEISYKGRVIGTFKLYNDGLATSEWNFKAHWINTIALKLVTHGNEQKDGSYIIKIDETGGGELLDITPPNNLPNSN